MTPVEWFELRSAATLAHALPNVGVRVSFGGEVVFDVPCDVGPCRFRAAVARAAAERSEPPWMATRPTRGDDALTVELELPSSSVTLPGGICRVLVGSRQLYAFTTSATVDVIRAGTAALTEEVGEVPGLWGVGIRCDPVTDVRLVYCELDIEHQRTTEPVVVDLLQSLAARYAVEQLLASSAPVPPGGRER